MGKRAANDGGNFGERPSHTWFAVRYPLGYKNIVNYDGSQTEWVTWSPRRPPPRS